MVHPALKAKGYLQSNVHRPQPSSFITIIAPLPPPIEHPNYYSHLPDPPPNDPFPAIRAVFDLMTPLEFANLLRKRIKHFLQTWPPPQPNEGTVSSLTAEAIHAFISFWHPEDFRTASTGVSIAELHTHLLALETLLSFVSAIELRDLVKARLIVDGSSVRERWAAVQGLLEVMKYACPGDKETSQSMGTLLKNVAHVGVSTERVDSESEEERPRKRPKLTTSLEEVANIPPQTRPGFVLKLTHPPISIPEPNPTSGIAEADAEVDMDMDVSEDDVAKTMDDTQPKLYVNNGVDGNAIPTPKPIIPALPPATSESPSVPVPQTARTPTITLNPSQQQEVPPVTERPPHLVTPNVITPLHPLQQIQPQISSKAPSQHISPIQPQQTPPPIPPPPASQPSKWQNSLKTNLDVRTPQFHPANDVPKPTSRFLGAPMFVKAQQPQTALSNLWVNESTTGNGKDIPPVQVSSSSTSQTQPSPPPPSISTSQLPPPPPSIPAAHVTPPPARPTPPSSQPPTQYAQPASPTVHVKREMINSWDAAYADPMEMLESESRSVFLSRYSQQYGQPQHQYIRGGGSIPTGPRALAGQVGSGSGQGYGARQGSPPGTRSNPNVGGMSGQIQRSQQLHYHQQRSASRPPPPSSSVLRSMFVPPSGDPTSPKLYAGTPPPMLKPEGPELPPSPLKFERGRTPFTDQQSLPFPNPLIPPRHMEPWRPSMEPGRGRSRSRSTASSRSRSRSSSLDRHKRGRRSTRTRSVSTSGRARSRYHSKSRHSDSRSRSRSRSHSRTSTSKHSRSPTQYRKRNYSYSRPPSPSLSKYQSWPPPIDEEFGRNANPSVGGSGGNVLPRGGGADDASQHSSYRSRSVTPSQNNYASRGHPDLWSPRRETHIHNGPHNHNHNRNNMNMYGNSSILARPMAGGPIVNVRRGRGGLPMRPR